MCALAAAAGETETYAGTAWVKFKLQQKKQKGSGPT